MRLYLTKEEAKRLLWALMKETDLSEKDVKLINRIEHCLEIQKPIPKPELNPPDES